MSGGYSYLLSNRLAQGSKPPVGVSLPFEVIVLAAWEYQPNMRGFETIHIPLDDDFETPVSSRDKSRIHAVAHTVAERVRNGGRVLVTCHQGRNRSGVISGLAMVELGVARKEAVRRIRTMRNGLTNPHFLRMLLEG